jgi:signal-transduction protein with cAMP-binding, CBS, and nucleotidyltransferase domain
MKSRGIAPVVHMTRFLSIERSSIKTWCGTTTQLGEIVSTCRIATVTCPNCKDAHDFALAQGGGKHATT